MKKILTILMSLVAILQSWAAGTKIGELYYNLNSSTKTASVTYDTSSTPYSSNPAYSNFSNKSLTIPEKVVYSGVEYKVTSVDSNAFENCSGLTSVTFPEGLTEIGSRAFRNCSGLTSINFPESLTSIGEFAFWICSGLKEVNIPSFEVWCNIKFSGPGTISNPNYYAKNLLINGKELSGVVKLPSDWTEVPANQFIGCDAVTEFILPQSLTTIGSYAFTHCSGLTSVTFPQGLTTIGEDAFRDCSRLTSITFPEGITSIGERAFGSCDGLTSINFPESLTSISKDAFWFCTGLTSIKLPKCLTEIGEYAFYGSGLTSVILPEGLTEIGNYTFDYCSKLRQVISLNPTPPKNYVNAFSTPAVGNDGVLYVPEASLETYLSTDYWNQFQNIQPIIRAKGLEILAEKNPLAVGQTEQINITLTPEEATFDQFSWRSSDESVATVDATGVVSALKTGTTTITAKTIDGTGISATLELTVTDSNGCFSINDFEIGIGAELELPVNLDLNFTDCSYSALQFDLTLPEGIALEDVTLGDELLDTGMNLTYRAQDNGDIRVIVTPGDNVEGTDCIENVVTLSLKASDNASPGTEKLLLSNASLATMQGADIFLDDSSCSVTLRKLLLGDANDNGSVTVADVVTIANFIAKKEVTGWCFANADVNRDKQITPADITGTVNIIAGEEIAPAAIVARRATQAENDRLVIDNFSPVESESFRIGVHLNNTRQYSALHSSVLIPEGMTVESVSKGSQAPSHSLIHNVTDEGRLEVVIFSTSNKPFSATDGSLFELEVRATADCGDIRMENILASDASATDYELMYEGGRNAGVTTGVDGTYDLKPKVLADAQGITVYNAEGMNVSIYAVTGEIIANRKATANPERFPLTQGIYVVTIEGNTFKIKI